MTVNPQIECVRWAMSLVTWPNGSARVLCDDHVHAARRIADSLGITLKIQGTFPTRCQMNKPVEYNEP